MLSLMGAADTARQSWPRRGARWGTLKRLSGSLDGKLSLLFLAFLRGCSMIASGPGNTRAV
jgi:hypothetical protein